MAIIKSLAVGRAKGSAQDLTYTTIGGATIMKGKVAFPKNPKTTGQMNRRVRWANLVNFWQAFNNINHPSFEGRAPRVSDFNAFIGANIAGAPVYLTISEASQGAAVVASYMVSRGSLPAIDIAVGTGGVPVTDISLGNLTIDGDTTLKEFSEAVVNNNTAYQTGDQISCYVFQQETNPVTGIPYVNVVAEEVTLNTADEDSLLADIVGNGYGFRSVDGKLGMSGTVNGGAAYIHSRIEGDGSVRVSTQSIYVSNALLAQYQTSNKKTEAILSYGGKTTVDFLRPNVNLDIDTF